MQTSELLCQGYTVYWCYVINIHPMEERAEDITESIYQTIQMFLNGIPSSICKEKEWNFVVMYCFQRAEHDHH